MSGKEGPPKEINLDETQQVIELAEGFMNVLTKSLLPLKTKEVITRIIVAAYFDVSKGIFRDEGGGEQLDSK